MERSIERLRSPLPPSIASLAEEAGVHPVYFTRVFRAALCATPSAVAQQARLERATTELLQSDARVAAIAHQAGFADHSHFCRQFKRTVGVTPSDYRKIFGHDLSQAWPLGRAQGDDDVVPPGSSSG
jgi:AraC family transcriptional regulator